MRKFKIVVQNFINSVNCNDLKVVILVLTLTLTPWYGITITFAWKKITYNWKVWRNLFSVSVIRDCSLNVYFRYETGKCLGVFKQKKEKRKKKNRKEKKRKKWATEMHFLCSLLHSWDFFLARSHLRRAYLKEKDSETQWRITHCPPTG